MALKWEASGQDIVGRDGESRQTNGRQNDE